MSERVEPETVDNLQCVLQKGPQVPKLGYVSRVGGPVQHQLMLLSGTCSCFTHWCTMQQVDWCSSLTVSGGANQITSAAVSGVCCCKRALLLSGQ